MEKEQIIDIVKSIMTKSHTERYESEELNELFTALAKAQEAMETAKLDSENPYFKSKYADLASVIKASRPALTKNGLSIIQRVLPNGQMGAMYLHTRLCHSSGQWIESKMLINPPKQDIQTMGSYLTYLRRYNYSSICGVYAGDLDDDGEFVMQRHETVYGKKIEADSTISQSQLEQLVNAFNGDEERIQKTLEHYGISKLADLPSKNFQKLMKGLADINKGK